MKENKTELSVETENLALPEVHVDKEDIDDEFIDDEEDTNEFQAIPEIHLHPKK